jgi:hypothetical protein
VILGKDNVPFARTRVYTRYHPLGAIPRYVLEREQKERNVFVPDLIRKCVVFLGIENDDRRFRPMGTGFFVHVGEENIQYTHLVTAEHVVAMIGEKIAKEEHEQGIKGWLAARLNVKGGGSEVVSLQGAHWWSHPDPLNPTDVAVTPWAAQREYFDHFPLPLYGAVVGASQTGHLRRRGAGLGQEIAIIGLFRHHRGEQRNEPIVRIGNIAAMPEERVWTKWCDYTEAYLVEANSIGGLSGSPVFVNLYHSGPVSMNVGGVNQYESKDGTVDFRVYMLMGLMHGHWDLPNLTDAAIEDGKQENERINTGVGVVIPVQKIIETLYQPELAEMRKKFEEEKRRKEGATPDLADDDHKPASESAAPANGANPKHREDFRRLLGAAARKPAPKD